MVSSQSSVVLEELTDPSAQAAARLQREQFDRNAEWFRSHSKEIYLKQRGKCICIAGQELFVASNAADALLQGTTAHSDDHGRFVRYIPLEKVPRNYAH